MISHASSETSGRLWVVADHKLWLVGAHKGVAAFPRETTCLTACNSDWNCIMLLYKLPMFHLILSLANPTRSRSQFIKFGSLVSALKLQIMLLYLLVSMLTVCISVARWQLSNHRTRGLNLSYLHGNYRTWVITARVNGCKCVTWQDTYLN